MNGLYRAENDENATDKDRQIAQLVQDLTNPDPETIVFPHIRETVAYYKNTNVRKDMIK